MARNGILLAVTVSHSLGLRTKTPQSDNGLKGRDDAISNSGHAGQPGLSVRAPLKQVYPHRKWGTLHLSYCSVTGPTVF